jgi:hypothetical protein
MTLAGDQRADRAGSPASDNGKFDWTGCEISRIDGNR